MVFQTALNSLAMAGCPDSFKLLRAPAGPAMHASTPSRPVKPNGKGLLACCFPTALWSCNLHSAYSHINISQQGSTGSAFPFPFLSRDLQPIAPSLYPQHRFCFHPSKHLSFSAPLTGNSRPYQSNTNLLSLTSALSADLTQSSQMLPQKVIAQ